MFSSAVACVDFEKFMKDYSMAAKRNKIELKTFEGYGKPEVIGYKTVEDSDETNNNCAALMDNTTSETSESESSKPVDDSDDEERY